MQALANYSKGSFTPDIPIPPHHHPLKTQNNLQRALDQVLFKNSEKV